MKHLSLITLAFLLLACAEYRQDGPAMEPTIKDNDLIDADMAAYSSAGPKRWDIVIFGSPLGKGDLVSRVVGMPGETIDIANGAITINGTAQTPPDSTLRYVKDLSEKIVMPYVVPKDSYFLLGDNNSEARDSREFGAIPRAMIKGKVTGINSNPLQKTILDEGEQ